MVVEKIAVISALSDPYYDHIKSGRKRWELRLRKKEWTDIRPGDHLLLFQHGGKGNFLILRVEERRDYSSFEEALRDVGVKNAIPQAETVEDAIAEYRRFYTPEKEKQHGVAAFRIKIVAEYPGELTKETLAKYLPHFKE